jgi:hypothetical protein
MNKDKWYNLKISLATLAAISLGAGANFLSNGCTQSKITSEVSQVENLMQRGFYDEAKERAETNIKTIERITSGNIELSMGFNTNKLNSALKNYRQILSNHYAGVYAPKLYDSTISGNTTSRTNLQVSH